MKILGFDIGGSAIKVAPVSTGKGILLTERIRIATPQPPTPINIAATVGDIARINNWNGAIGIGFPATVVGQVVMTANNIDASWIGQDASVIFSEATSCPVYVINDADAAGIAEMKFGAGKGEKGVVIVLTIGTGVGSSLFTNGKLVPNTELGQMRMGGDRAETYVSDSMRKRLSLTWEEWGQRMNKYLSDIDDLFRPSLIILGGGACHKAAHFMGILEVRSRIITAQLQNEAGIIGAALAAKTYLKK